MTPPPRVGLLWRAEWDPVDPSANVRETCRLHAMFSAFDELGVRAEPVVYSDSAAAQGVWVSAHPDVVQRMATKQVLVDTAAMSWSAPTHLYRTHDQLRAELPQRLDERALVLKQHWGMGGTGVWKVERRGPDEVRGPARGVGQRG